MEIFLPFFFTRQETGWHGDAVVSTDASQLDGPELKPVNLTVSFWHLCILSWLMLPLSTPLSPDLTQEKSYRTQKCVQISL